MSKLDTCRALALVAVAIIYSTDERKTSRFMTNTAAYLNIRR